MLKKDIEAQLKEKLIESLGKDRNILSLPTLNKVVLNYRVVNAKESKETLETAIDELTAIAGQKPSLCRSKKSEAGFKIRQGDPLALKVTLRGQRMYDFVEKLFNIILPRLRDFKGMSLNAFDDAGNYNLTIMDQTLFPEINLDKVHTIRPLQITLNINSSSKEDSKMLLSALGFSFEKK